MVQKQKVIEAYKKKSIGMLTLIDFCKVNGWILTIYPSGRIDLENE